MMTNERQTTERVNVVVMPGLLGSQITSMERTQGREPIWLSISQIVAGHLDRLRLAAHELIETNHNYTIHVTGIMKRYCGELMLTLAEHYTLNTKSGGLYRIFTHRPPAPPPADIDSYTDCSKSRAAPTIPRVYLVQ